MTLLFAELAAWLTERHLVTDFSVGEVEN